MIARGLTRLLALLLLLAGGVAMGQAGEEFLGPEAISTESWHKAAFRAIETGDLALLELALAQRPELVEPTRDGNTVLLAAATAGDLPAVTRLLAAGAEPMPMPAKNYLRPPLVEAIQLDRRAIVRAMLAAGVELTAVADDGSLPLHHAWLYARRELAAELTPAGYEPDPYVAAATGDLAAVQAALDAQAALLGRPRAGGLLIHYALTNGQEAVALEFLKREPRLTNMRIRDPGRGDALRDLMIRSGDLAQLTALRAYWSDKLLVNLEPALVDYLLSDAGAPMLQVFVDADVSLAPLILQANPPTITDPRVKAERFLHFLRLQPQAAVDDPGVVNTINALALAQADEWFFTELAALKIPILPPRADSATQTWIYLNPHPRLAANLKRLLATWKEAAEADYHFAWDEAHFRVIATHATAADVLWLWRTQDPKATDGQRQLTLSRWLPSVAVAQRGDILLALLDSEIPVRSVLTLEDAATCGELALIEALLGDGPPLNAKTGDRDADALIAACRYGHVAAAKRLVAAGIPLDCQTDWGAPLTVAAAGGHVAVMDWLVEAGASLEQDGPMALQESYPHQLAAANWLLDHGVPWPTEAYWRGRLVERAVYRIGAEETPDRWQHLDRLLAAGLKLRVDSLAGNPIYAAALRQDLTLIDGLLARQPDLATSTAVWMSLTRNTNPLATVKRLLAAGATLSPIALAADGTYETRWPEAGLAMIRAGVRAKAERGPTEKEARAEIKATNQLTSLLARKDYDLARAVVEPFAADARQRIMQRVRLSFKEAEAVDLLVDAGLDLQQTTLLVDAIKQGEDAVALRLLERGVNPNAASQLTTPLAVALAYEHNESWQRRREKVGGIQDWRERLLAAGAGVDDMSWYVVSDQPEEARRLAAQQPTTLSAYGADNNGTALALAAIYGRRWFIPLYHHYLPHTMNKGYPHTQPIVLALRHRHLDVARDLVAHGVNLRLGSDWAAPALTAAIESGDRVAYEWVVSFGHSPLRILGNGSALHGRRPYTAVSVAAQSGDLELLQALEYMGGDIREAAQTPLRLAATNGHADVVDYLLREGEMLSPALLGDSKFHTGIIAHDYDRVFARITQAIATSDQLAVSKEDWLRASLRLAASEGAVGCLRVLLSYEGTREMAWDTRGRRTALYFAVAAGQVPAARYLLEAGCTSAHPDIFMHVLKTGDTDFVRLCMAKGLHRIEGSASPSSALYYAVETGQLPLVRYLVEEIGYGIAAGPGVLDARVQAVIRQDAPIVAYLFEQDAVAEHWSHEHTPYLLMMGRLDLLDRLLALGYTLPAEPADQAKMLETVIDKTPPRVRTKADDLLASVNWWQAHDLAMDYGVLRAATKRLDGTLVARLLELGVPAKGPAGRDDLPLQMVAISDAYLPIARQLIDHGADLTAERGSQPLYIAARYGAAKMIRLLAAQGADLNACDRSGHQYAPIHIAAESGHLAAVQALVELGADPTLPSGKQQRSPIDMARSRAQRDVADYLDSLPARPTPAQALEPTGVR